MTQELHTTSLEAQADVTTPGGEGPTADYEVQLESLNQWQLAWRKFRRHHLALVGLGILVVLIVAAVIGPMIAATIRTARMTRPARARWCRRNFRHASCHWFSDSS